MSYFYLTYQNEIHHVIKKTIIEHSITGKIFSINYDCDSDESSIEFYINGYSYKKFYEEFKDDNINVTPSFFEREIREILENKYYSIIDENERRKKLRCRKFHKPRRIKHYGRK